KSVIMLPFVQLFVPSAGRSDTVDGCLRSLCKHAAQQNYKVRRRAVVPRTVEPTSPHDVVPEEHSHASIIACLKYILAPSVQVIGEAPAKFVRRPVENGTRERRLYTALLSLDTAELFD